MTSASERLRALDERFRAEPTQRGQHDHFYAFARALPLIADVVEAAEDADEQYFDQTAHDLGWPIELRAALTALRDALEEK